MLEQVNVIPTPHKRLPWNKGKLTGGKAAAAAQARLVDPNKAPDRRPGARPSHVQSGNRQ